MTDPTRQEIDAAIECLLRNGAMDVSSECSPLVYAPYTIGKEQPVFKPIRLIAQILSNMTGFREIGPDEPMEDVLNELVVHSRKPKKTKKKPAKKAATKK